MWRLVRWILKEILVGAAVVTVYDAVTSDNNRQETDNYSYNEGVIDYSPTTDETYYIHEYFPDWDLIESETNKEYFSNYMLSSDPIRDNDLFRVFLGEYDNGYSTITFKESEFTDFKADTVFFDYALLYDNSDLLKRGMAYFVHESGVLEFDDKSLETAILYKIENKRNNKYYLYMTSQNIINGEMLFLNTRPIIQN